MAIVIRPLLLNCYGRHNELSPSLIIVTTTSDRRDTLDNIAANLIEQKLAACVQIGGPITSHYCWDGKVEQAQEWTCAIKTLEDFYESVESRIKQLHHYDEPQIIATPIVQASQGYADWLVKSMTG